VRGHAGGRRRDDGEKRWGRGEKERGVTKESASYGGKSISVLKGEHKGKPRRMRETERGHAFTPREEPPSQHGYRKGRPPA